MSFRPLARPAPAAAGPGATSGSGDRPIRRFDCRLGGQDEAADGRQERPGERTRAPPLAGDRRRKRSTAPPRIAGDTRPMRPPTYDPLDRSRMIAVARWIRDDTLRGQRA